MKHKTTWLAMLWLLLMCVHQAWASPGGFALKNNTGLEMPVPPPPAAGFTYVTNGGCVPVTVQFYSQLNGPAYAWTFGDGGTSPDCNPVHTYTTPGVYTVTLIATGGTYTTTITVGANPVVTFGGDSVSCLNDVKSYTASSTIAPASYSWSAQGGTVSGSTATSANVTWTSYGVNYLSYTITTPAGCTKIFRYKVKVIPPPSVNLPCCEKRGNPTGNPPDGRVQPGGDQGEKGEDGGDAPCSACAGSYNCYHATVDPEFGTASDYVWTWTVTNGVIVSISADSTTACVIWGSSGTGKIKLDVKHKIYGCHALKECEVIIKPGVTPSFTVSGLCVNAPVYFDATGTTPLSDVVSFAWEFGDGYTSTTTTPFANHQFTFTGSYTATLTITTKAGCTYKTTYSFNIISGTRPTIVCPGTVCEGSRQCYSTDSIAGAVYAWTISGDILADRVITGNKVCVTWGAGPVGTVSVTVTGGGYTCTPTASESVSIVSSSIPISAPDHICSTLTWLQVSTANYAGACYRWSINGVPQGSAINTLSFDPSAFGSPITIKVDVDFPLGCCHGSGTKVITKLPSYTMNFYNHNACVGQTVVYNLLFPAGLPATPVAWSVTGGNIMASSATSVTIKWTTAGTGTITAGNNSPNQYCNDATNNSWNVTIWNPATGDDITGPAVVCAGSANTYYHGWQSPTASATVAVSPPGGVVISPSAYSSVITFPPVAVPTTYVVSVTYNHLYVTPCATTKTYSVLVLPNTVPSFSGTGGVICEGDTVTYTANVPDTINYTWNVIGGSIISQVYSGTTLTIKVQWNSTLTSSLTITNKICGLTTTQPETVNGRPVVIITTGTPVCGGTSVSLRVAPVWAAYNWSNGALTNITAATASGTYSVTVSNGVCSSTGSVYVPVVAPVPPNINSYTVTPSSFNICPKYNQICANITPGSGSITTYSWAFTGFTAASSSAVCPYVALAGMPGPSTGYWKLTITDSYGCTDTLTSSLTDSCIIDTVISPGGDTPCVSVATLSVSYNPCSGQFTTSGTNYSSISWYYGDGYTGYGLNPVHFYSTACNKNIVCYVTDINGCTHAFYFTIPVPYVFYNLSVTATNGICGGASKITANGLAICGTGTASYSWSIVPVGGTTAIYTAVTPTNILNVGSISLIPAGNYTANVTITYAGCSRSTSGTFNKGGVDARFVSCGGCAGSALTFIDQSVPYNAPIIKWNWKFQSGATILTSTLQNPTVLFTVPGTYTVTLIVTDNNPCSDTFVTTVNILPPFTPGLIKVNGVTTASGTTFNICPGSTYNLWAPHGASYVWSTGSTDSIIQVTGPGDYYVTVFNTTNCSAKIGPIKFLYKPAPEAIFVTGSGNNCAPRLIRAFTGTGYSYLWNYPVSATSTQSYINMYTSGPVTLTVTNLYGCSDSKTQTFNVFPSPFAYINPVTLPFCPPASISLNGIVSGGTPPYSGHLWNNGNMTPSITVQNPGLYTYHVLDANGCPADAQYNLQPATPPGMDLLPKGCYDICGQSVTFCTGTMPWGWTGQWYLNGSPVGPAIAQGGNMATTFTSSGSYVLHYIPVNPSASCPAQSAPININFIPLPVFVINGGVPTVQLCSSSSSGVLLTVNIQSPVYNYTWYLNGVVVGSGYTYTATAPGHYVLIISKGACCRTSASIDVIEVNCCFDNPGVPFTPILHDSIISSNEFWFNKYYIDAVVTVTGSAVLDLTNVDCVFGPNGTIVFKDQSFFRCNNSVLRPCEKDNIWIGTQFFDAASGWINTSTIKNAITGVAINGNVAGVRITDNSFLKCQVGVGISDSRAQQSISGNTFEIDESRLPYQSSPNVYWGIKLLSTEMKGVIAQNNFRHVLLEKPNNTYHGIYAEYSNCTISENQFNDLFRAIDITGNRDVVAIEKNDVKINNLKTNYDRYQVRVTNCELPVLIYENHMDNGLADNSIAGAIYCEKDVRTHIKDNQINGFMLGMVAISCDNMYVASNTLTSNSAMGITLWRTNRSVVSCNNINAMNTNGSTRYGIVELDGDGSNNYYSNCIFNMNTAMYFRGINPGYNLPAIYNNYMYNYDVTGIFSFNYSGSIGAPFGPTAAGRNTFMSNNGSAGTTLDINAAPPITEDGNFGILLTSGTSTSSPPDQFYSTSACGHQIEGNYAKNQLDRFNVCDVYNLDKWVFRTAEGNYHVADPLEGLTADVINKAIAAGQGEILGQAGAAMLKEGIVADNAADALLNSKVDRNKAARLIVQSYLAKNNVQGATSYLASPLLAGMDKQMRSVLEIEIAIAGKTVLNSAQRSMLAAIDNMNIEASPIARDILQAKENEYDYLFKRAESPVIGSQTGKVVSKVNNMLSVYPVPASQEINVQYNVKDAKVEGLKLISVTGAEVTKYTYSIQSGIINIDISALAEGVYTVMLITGSDSHPAMTGRFIKIK